MPFLGQSPAAVITGNGILDGTITAADLHTTLDLSTKTITYPSNSVTAAALHTTAVTDKLGYTPLQSSDLTGYATETYVNTAVATVDLTGYATESYVTTAVSNLVDSAPGALDTLNELAAALNDDANFSTTITNSLALKAPLASPSFTGNVGIGTSSPSALLDVVDTTVATYPVQAAKFGNIGGAQGALQVIGYSNTEWGFNALNSRNMVFKTNQTEHMRIDSSGNVGIGTSSPAVKLHVDAGAINEMQRYNTTGTSPYVTWYISGTRKAYQQFSSGTGFIIDSEEASTNILFRTQNLERMRITSTGNVGIGTSNPLGTLSVLGGGRLVTIGDSGTANTPAITARNTTDTGYAFLNISTYRTRFFTEGSERMIITESGNVGIGTSSPAAKLEIFSGSSGSDALRIESSKANGVDDLYGEIVFSHNSTFPNNGSAIQAASFYNDAGDLRFLTSYASSRTERMRITTQGNVGIGTSSPAGKLQVNAPATTAPSLTFGTLSGQILRNENSEFAFGLWNASPYPLYIQGRHSGNVARDIVIQPLGGNVGIGTDNPHYLFQVGSTSTSNTVMSILGANNTASLLDFRSDGGLPDGDSTYGARIGYDGALNRFLIQNNNANVFTTALAIGRTDQQLYFDSGYGSAAAAYGCRAWVKFNTVTTVSIQASANISSITDNGVGETLINFTTAMPDANYVVSGTARDANTNTAVAPLLCLGRSDSVKSTTQFEATVAAADSATLYDSPEVNVVIHR